MFARFFTRLALISVLAPILAFTPLAASAQSGTVSDTFSAEELLETGGHFFGQVAQGLAALVEQTVSQYGLPNGYVLGEEASGAFVAGVRYGDGTLYTKNAGQHQIFWQGPSLGFDWGVDGSRVMMLVYNLPSVGAIYDRYPGVDGSAFVLGGLGMSVIKRGDVIIVPIRSGVGARLGVNVSYLKITPEATWNPF
ncbi:MAG: DUF1134 domain-containing protein [Alphaproteobacteria bacterium]|nr:DUF1134 domain-containing protein [Alphaproteobacteria bacterium]